MKRLLLITLTLLIASGIYASDWRRSENIQANGLPANAQNIIKKYFDGLSSVLDARKWPNNYSVYMETGHKLKFYLDGTLKEAKGERRELPKSILSEFPKSISSYINQKYSDWKIKDIEVKRSKIEIELEKGRLSADLEFNKSGELLDEDIDD